MVKSSISGSVLLVLLYINYSTAYYSPDQCGRPPMSRGKRMIRGGQIVDAIAYPFIAGLWVLDEDMSLRSTCTGALISPNYVISAAHCFKTYNRTKVFFGRNDIMDDDEDYYLGTATIHPNYIDASTGQYMNNQNDLAIIKLDRPVRLSHKVYPICLASQILVETEEIVTSIGYGHFRDTIHEREMVDRRLRSVNVPMRRCKPPMKTEDVCTGTMNGGTESGDSGGPLTIQINGAYTSIGILSMGGTFSNKQKKIVDAMSYYTRIPPYCDYIHEFTEGEVACM